MRRLGWVLALLSSVASYGWGKESKQQPDSQGIYLIGNGVRPPRLTTAIPAVYPADASKLHPKVSRTLSVVIGADGALTKIEYPGRGDLFSQAAVAAIAQSRFKAGSLEGKSVPVRVLVWVPFVPGKRHYLPIILPALEFDRPPTTISNLPPNLLDQPRKERHGVVEISLVVGEDGLPTDLQVMQSSSKDLEKGVLEAAQHLRYRPAMKDGLPIPVEIVITVRFH